MIRKSLNYSPVRFLTSKGDHPKEDTRGKKPIGSNSPSPGPLGGGPKIEVTRAPPVFSPLVKILKTDPEYVASLE